MLVQRRFVVVSIPKFQRAGSTCNDLEGIDLPFKDDELLPAVHLAGRLVQLVAVDVGLLGLDVLDAVREQLQELW